MISGYLASYAGADASPELPNGTRILYVHDPSVPLRIKLALMPDFFSTDYEMPLAIDEGITQGV
ncbi:hypothetical protein DIPPA_22421 [Diplonema papillatum]|nr:hypothetical protein DIPPA_22421 [Diplonema papillatum]